VDQKICDRCGERFRAAGGEGKNTPLEEKYKSPPGLPPIERINMPLACKKKDPKAPDQYILGPVDACGQCLLDLVPLIQEWIVGKKQRG
jgi:hypothetical protein